jgi:hypothetical protein
MYIFHILGFGEAFPCFWRHSRKWHRSNRVFIFMTQHYIFRSIRPWFAQITMDKSIHCKELEILIFKSALLSYCFRFCESFCREKWRPVGSIIPIGGQSIGIKAPIGTFFCPTDVFGKLSRPKIKRFRHIGNNVLILVSDSYTHNTTPLIAERSALSGVVLCVYECHIQLWVG